MSLGGDASSAWLNWKGDNGLKISKDNERLFKLDVLERTVISRVDGELWDLERPLEKSVKLELLQFDDPEGTLPGLCS